MNFLFFFQIWEGGIKLCKELSQQYEEKLLDYTKLSEILVSGKSTYEMFFSKYEKIEYQLFLLKATWHFVVANSGADNELKNGLPCKFSAKKFFWLLWPWMCSLLDEMYETFTFFQITGSGNIIFMYNWWDFDIFWDIFILLEPFFIWSRPTPHFYQKTQLIGVIILKFIILKTGSALKLLFLFKMIF